MMSSMEARNLILSWVGVFHSFINDGKKNSPNASEESGYSSRRSSLESEDLIISKVTYKIACESGGDFKGVTKELHLSKIPKDLELETKKLCARVSHKKFCLCFRAGFSDCIFVVLRNGSLKRLVKFPRLCELLTREWSQGRIDFEYMKRWWSSSTASKQARLHSLFSVVICIYFDKPTVRDLLTLSFARPSEQPPKTLFSSPSSSSESPKSTLSIVNSPEESGFPSRPRAEKPLDFAPEGPVWSKEAFQSLKNSYSNDGLTPKSMFLSALKCFDPTVFQERIQSRNGGDRNTPLGSSELGCGQPSFFQQLASTDYYAFPICHYAYDFLKTEDRNPALTAAIRRATNIDSSCMLKLPSGGESKMFGKWSPP